ncbi:MAG: hypothetical protein NVSMB55_10300 [Mycobacteriales bacterium]
MAIGQGVLGAAALDVAELDRVAACIEGEERDRSLRHARQLGNVLELHRVYAQAGMALSTPAYLALLLQCSETRANTLLCDAQVLVRLGALEDMRQGLLTVEQSRAVVDMLGVLPSDALGASLWERLRERLVADQAQELVRPPARLRELLKGWIIAADPDGFIARRKTTAEIDADVELWKRDDGLADLAGRGLSAADAQACLDRIEELAQPTGPDDERSAGQRRRDAYRDVLLGRLVLPVDIATGELIPAAPAVASAAAPAVAACCPPGSAAPCGAQIFVHAPLPAAAGLPSKPAELVGHGPIDPALLADLLANSPVLHRVWVDAMTGVPVAVDDRVWTPGRDPQALSDALAELRSGAPPEQRHPVHPDDHRPDHAHNRPPAPLGGAPGPAPGGPPGPAPGRPPGPAPGGPPTVLPHTPARPDPSLAPGVLTRPHLADPGAYVPPRRLKQLLRVRAPRCEWPGCGRRASRAVAAGCDLDHDLAWPHGPTCSCNLGPLCRRHHRIKQLGWIKRRRDDGSVSWTDHTGRSWTSPAQGFGPAPAPRWTEVSAGVWALAA